jgi:oligoendopeptidase F
MVEEKVLAEASPEDKLIALDQILSNSVGTLLDLHARFHFEQELFARRETRTLAVDELTRLMAEKQQTAYGPGLAADGVHKWQWVQKPHYYDTDFHYYNYPYQFGLLFALGLLKVYRDQPDGFAERYETLLSRTGMATAYDLAKEFGIDIRDRAFWDGSVAVIRGDVAQFEQVAAQSTR